MDDLIRPDEDLEAKEFEEATRNRWQRPQLPSRPKMPRFKISELDWALNKWVIGLFVILVVLFGGRYLHHVLKSDDTKNKPTTAQTTATSQPTASSAGSTNTGSTTTPAGTSQNISQTPGQVPNTGPGSTAAIFVVATLLAGSAHYFVTSTRKSS